MNSSKVILEVSRKAFSGYMLLFYLGDYKTRVSPKCIKYACSTAVEIAVTGGAVNRFLRAEILTLCENIYFV